MQEAPASVRDGGMIECFLVDYGIHWDCNIACTYCRNQPIRNSSPRVHPDERLARYMGGLTRISRSVRATMFKTSGWGEITTVPGYTMLFRHARDLGYEVLQLITNGVKLLDHETLAELQDLGYFSLQMSIDGLTMDENEYRFGHNAALLTQVWGNLERALSIGVPVEINSVLTDLNTARLRPFLEHLIRLRERYGTPLVCVPRCVRVKRTLNNYSQLPHAEQIETLEGVLLDSYSAFESVLPPKQYVSALLHHLRNRQRRWTAYDTVVRLNVGPSGDLVLFTREGNRDLGSIFGDHADEAFETRRKHHSYFGEVDHQLKMTQFDVHYLYLAGEISLDEMAKIPSCVNPPAQTWLAHLREGTSLAMSV